MNCTLSDSIGLKRPDVWLSDAIKKNHTAVYISIHTNDALFINRIYSCIHFKRIEWLLMFMYGFHS